MDAFRSIWNQFVEALALLLSGVLVFIGAITKMVFFALAYVLAFIESAHAYVKKHQPKDL